MEDTNVLEDLTRIEEPTIIDFKRLAELTSYSEKGSSQLSYLVKIWEWKQENAVKLLREEFEHLSKQHKIEFKKFEILEEHQLKDQSYGGDTDMSTNTDIDTVNYWKQRALHSEKLLEESVKPEKIILEKLEESIENLAKRSSPVEELSQILKRADNFLHFVLQNAPILIGHQDKELRYRFIYNHFPSLKEEDIIGKTDVEIFKGGGVKECQDFKREVLERGLPGKREITFETELFGAKTFLMYVEPVFDKTGETIGVNYMGMEITDQVKKREKMVKLREEIAVQKAKEIELNNAIKITEETMRAKAMIDTISDLIRSPLSEIVNMAGTLSTTKLDKHQKQSLSAMLSLGYLVLQHISDIIDLSNIESGVMKLETKPFRPREVIKHVLETAAASLKKMTILEGRVADDVPIEVIGDVLRFQQIVTNLISNAVKFTHEGKVSINLYMISDSCLEDKLKPKIYNGSESHELVVWICCDVQDTGTGIAESTLPLLFNEQYGGTGLGLAVCKQLVELMGGRLTVSNNERCGSTFTFVLPYKVPYACEISDDKASRDEESYSSFHYEPSNLDSESA